MAADTVAAPAKMVSSTPGRIRVRVAPEKRPEIGTVKDTLQDHAGINRVKANPSSGSLLVEYDDGSLDFDEVVALLADLGVLVLETFGDDDYVGLLGLVGKAAGLVGRVPSPNGALSSLPGAIDGRLLAPLGVGALGVALVMCRSNAGLSGLPPFLLLALALAAYRQLRSRQAKA
jgi:hypothetical protein